MSQKIGLRGEASCLIVWGCQKIFKNTIEGVPFRGTGVGGVACLQVKFSF